MSIRFCVASAISCGDVPPYVFSNFLSTACLLGFLEGFGVLDPKPPPLRLPPPSAAAWLVQVDANEARRTNGVGGSTKLWLASGNSATGATSTESSNRGCDLHLDALLMAFYGMGGCTGKQTLYLRQGRRGRNELGYR